MGYRGTVKGKLIELDEPLPLEEGTRVDITVTLEQTPRKGSPRAILQLKGTLTHEEAELVRRTIAEMRKVDSELWQ